MSGELKPCPFCGGQGELTGFAAPEFWVHCSAIGCKAGTEAFGSKERAIAAWNRRATPSQGLDAATVERCAQVAEAFEGSAALERCDDPTSATGSEIADRIRALATDPHQHGAGNGEKHGG